MPVCARADMNANIRCANCGAVWDDDTDESGWFHLERDMLERPGFPQAWDFCSVECAAERLAAGTDE